MRGGTPDLYGDPFRTRYFILDPNGQPVVELEQRVHLDFLTGWFKRFVLLHIGDLGGSTGQTPTRSGEGHARAAARGSVIAMAPKFPVGPDGRYEYPKLSAGQLRAIYERNPCPEVRDLLWEIHRLRILLLCANQLQKAYDCGCHVSHMQILEKFRADICGEPCIEEREAWEREFFGPLRQSVYTRNKNRRD
ncbi:hypothetical protein OR16_04572 [Cupriavidus basilensis OR16]|uniref:Uncharacterized protein n=2 Tax=Cupriavidus basilensis TaxID=68895 RepID=H1S006_9BURK|nr:hypothetical protein OR16_04572 [Cupriavidus basilensis OR16]